MYQDIYEYKDPLTNPEPNVYLFETPDVKKPGNPWKDSFQTLVSHSCIIRIRLSVLVV